MMHTQFTPNLPGSNNGAASTRGRAVDQYDRGFNGADAQQDDMTDYEALGLARQGKLTTQGYHDDGFLVEDGDSLSEEEFSESEEEESESEEEDSEESEEESESEEEDSEESESEEESEDEDVEMADTEEEELQEAMLAEKNYLAFKSAQKVVEEDDLALAHHLASMDNSLVPDSTLLPPASTNPPTKAELSSLSRRELQALAKTYGIRANVKSSTIIDHIMTWFEQVSYTDDDVGETEDSEETAEIEMLRKFEAKEIEMLRKFEAKEIELQRKFEAKEIEMLRKFEAAEIEMRLKLEAKEIEMLRKYGTPYRRFSPGKYAELCNKLDESKKKLAYSEFEVVLWEGNALFGYRKYYEAVLKYTEALAIAPDKDAVGTVLHHRCQAYYWLRNLPAAKEDAWACVDRCPAYKNTRWGQGVVARRAKAGQAVAELAKTRPLFPVQSRESILYDMKKKLVKVRGRAVGVLVDEKKKKKKLVKVRGRAVGVLVDEKKKKKKKLEADSRDSLSLSYAMC